MTYSTIVKNITALSIFLRDPSDPSLGFILNIGNHNVDLECDQAAEIADYIYTHLPENFRE